MDISSHGRSYSLKTSEIEEALPIGKARSGLLGAVHAVLLRKYLVLLCGVVGCAFGLSQALLTKPSYTAKAVFLAPNSSNSSSVLIGQLGQLAGLSGSGGALSSLKDPGAICVGILQSRTVADDMIQQFDLQKLYRTKKLSATEKVLASHSKFIPGKDTLIAITVDDGDPQRAAAMANGYLKELSRQNDRLVLTEAGQRRVFFEKQLVQEKDRLADSEVALKQTEQETGLIHPTGQAQIQMAAIAQTEAEISNKEIQLAALSQSATSANPDVIRITSELDSLRDHLRELENSNGKGNPGNPMVPTSRVPELSLEYVRRDRDVKFHEALYALLLRQYESAKLDESRAAPLVQVIDEAVVPDWKSWPPRTLFVLVFTLIGTALGIGWVIATDTWARKMIDPENAANWQSIREAARLRRT
jgi:uncharacterized protein involved in exopolysaccharide biosynthesis